MRSWSHWAKDLTHSTDLASQSSQLVETDGSHGSTNGLVILRMPGEDRQAKEKLCTNTTQASDADQAVEVKVCHEATSEEMAPIS